MNSLGTDLARKTRATPGAILVALAMGAITAHLWAHSEEARMVLTPSIDSELEAEEPLDQCDAVYCRLLESMAPLEPHTEEETTIVLTWDAVGLIGNGGVQYLFEGDFYERDPGYKRTLAALQRIGANQAHRAFSEALTWFPDCLPPRDAEERLRVLGRVPDADRRRVDRLIWGGKTEFIQGLAAYIRRNKADIEDALRDHELRRTSKDGEPGSSGSD